MYKLLYVFCFLGVNRKDNFVEHGGGVAHQPKNYIHQKVV